MATYGVTTTARQDTVLAAVAAKRGATAQAYMDAALQKVLRQALAEFEADDAAAVSAAYLAATAAKQGQVKTALGL